MAFVSSWSSDGDLKNLVRFGNPKDDNPEADPITLSMENSSQKCEIVAEFQPSAVISRLVVISEARNVEVYVSKANEKNPDYLGTLKGCIEISCFFDTL